MRDEAKYCVTQTKNVRNITSVISLLSLVTKGTGHTNRESNTQKEAINPSIKNSFGKLLNVEKECFFAAVI